MQGQIASKVKDTAGVTVLTESSGIRRESGNGLLTGATNSAFRVEAMLAFTMAETPE